MPEEISGAMHVISRSSDVIDRKSEAGRCSGDWLSCWSLLLGTDTLSDLFTQQSNDNSSDECTESLPNDNQTYIDVHKTMVKVISTCRFPLHPWIQRCLVSTVLPIHSVHVCSEAYLNCEFCRIGGCCVVRKFLSSQS